MKAESDAITEDEWLIRLVWEDRATSREPIISPNAFEPRKTETDGISFFRRACLNDLAEALAAIAEDKRPRYAIVQIPVQLLTSLGLTARSAPVPPYRATLWCRKSTLPPIWRTKLALPQSNCD